MTSPVADIQSQAASAVGDAYVRGYEHGLASGVDRGKNAAAELTELRDIVATLLTHLENDCVPTRNAERASECRARLSALGIDVGEDDVTLLKVAQAKAALLRSLPGVRVPSKHFGEVVYTYGECQCAAFIGADGEVRISAAGEPASMRKEFARLCEEWGAALRSSQTDDAGDATQDPLKTSAFTPIEL